MDNTPAKKDNTPVNNDNVAFNEYLEKRYFSQMDYYRKASAKNQKQYKNFQWVLIILSTLTTILASLPENFHLQYVVVATAGVVTILTAGLKTFQYQELWTSYRATLEQLKPEIYKYKLMVGEYEGAPNKEALFVQRIENILNSEHASWKERRNSQEKISQQGIDELQQMLKNLIQENLNKNNPPLPVIPTKPDNTNPVQPPVQNGESEPGGGLQDESSANNEPENPLIQPEESETADPGQAGSDSAETNGGKDGK